MLVIQNDEGNKKNPALVVVPLSTQLKKMHIPVHEPLLKEDGMKTDSVTLCEQSGIDLVATAAELGHVNAATTATIYAHQIAVASARAADVRGGVFRHRTQSSEDNRNHNQPEKAVFRNSLADSLFSCSIISCNVSYFN